MAAALERALDSMPGLEEEKEVPGPAPVPLPVPVPVPVLVLGPAGSGRTSLLLRAALAGGAEGPRALYLAPCAPPRLPLEAGSGGNDPRALQRLELRYPPTLPALRQELAALGASCPRPGLLLLDDLDRYFPGSFLDAVGSEGPPPGFFPLGSLPGVLQLGGSLPVPSG